jgi:5-methylcytosine-specific restriction endonuclease McrA
MCDKKCRVCNDIKSMDDFAIKRAAKDGRMSICKKCDCERSKNWFTNNKEKAKFRALEYRSENREYVLQKDKERYYSNKEDELKKRKIYYLKNRLKIIEKVGNYYQSNKDVNRRSVKKHYQNNKPYYMAKCAKRRASKSGATPPWLTDMQMMQIKWFYSAAKMMTDISGIRHHVDHIHPIQGDGFTGLHVPWNLRIIKAEDNIKKGNKLPPELSHLMWER